MKQFLLFLTLGLSITFHVHAQDIILKKGIIHEALPVNDSIEESFAVYLPTTFQPVGKWPVLFIFDMEGRGKQALRMFKPVAEEYGYIMAAPNHISDTISLSKNILIANRTLNAVFSILPIHKNRVYGAGFDDGGEFASILPSFVRGIEGIISSGATIGNIELLNPKNAFHYVGIMGKQDYNYPNALELKKILHRMKFPNQLILFEGGHTWPKLEEIKKAFEILDLAAMAKGNIEKDSSRVQKSLETNLQDVEDLLAKEKYILADHLLGQILSVYRTHLNTDSLKEKKRFLKKQKAFRTQKRNEINILFKESLLKEDYIYFLYEDVVSYNYNNLGWWNYQMDEIKKFKKSSNIEEQNMGARLFDLANLLVEENIEAIEGEKIIDEEGLLFLWMLKTITDPKDYPYYLKVISNSAKHEEFGTALFYLEELLKNGYTNKAALYALENTALLRITPEYNEVIAKYLKEARYEPIEE